MEMTTYADPCVDGERFHLSRPEPGFNVCQRPGCGARHKINLPINKPTPVGRFVQPDECRDLGLLLGTVLVAFR